MPGQLLESLQPLDAKLKGPELAKLARNQIPAEWNQTKRAYPRDQCIHELFEVQANRAPEVVAVVCGAVSLTYGELNLRAEGLACRLRSLGVGPGDLVAVCLDRCVEMVIALLGILKTGGAYVPLDPAQPSERLRLLVEDTRATVMVVKQPDVWSLPPAVRVICLDLAEPLPDQSAHQGDSKTAGGDALAYVMHTSGSTGRAKGVCVPHRAIARLVLNTDYIQLGPEDVMAHAANPAFDAATFEIWGALLNGARLEIMPKETLLAPAKLAAWLRARRVTTLFVTTAFFNILARAAPEIFKPLKQVLFGGEAADPRMVGEVLRNGPPQRLLHVYGPTETTTFATWHLVESLPPEAVTVPIGRPVANTTAYVLDASQQSVPAGVPGELYIGGDGVAAGYLREPELTVERFIPDPFSEPPGARLYRTGDFVQWLPDGTLDFLGRLDTQVKIRGFRIELGEIERTLNTLPEIREAVVILVEDAPGEKRLAAFLVPSGSARPDTVSLRARLAEKLPEYMVPGVFGWREQIPLTPNGKIDRKALANVAGVTAAAGAAYVAPRTESERLLAEIWQAVLRREKVGVHDRFFDLGGHSLLAMAICSQAGRRLGFELPLRWVFDYPTIEGLARKITDSAEPPPAHGIIEKTDRQKPPPMSFGQQQMWLLQQISPDPATYNQPFACRLSGGVDREKIRSALHEMMRRHEVLRTTLVREAEALVQQIAGLETVALPWQEWDLKTVAAGQREAELARRLIDWAREPFDLSVAPLWRILWIDLGGEERVLGFTFHHGMVDEWSLRLFFQELERRYAAGPEAADEAPAQPVQYADYAVWQRQQLTGAVLDRQRAYWRERLQDLPPALELPADRTRPLHPSGRGGVHYFQITAPVTTGLGELARRENTTLFTVALAAFQIWLFRHTGQSDLIVGTPSANRERPEGQNLLGYFLNTLPIRTRMDAAADFPALLRQVRETILGAFDHAALPFQQIVEVAARERPAGQAPLFQVMFVLLEEGLPPLRLGQVQGRWVPVETQTSKYDLLLNIAVRDQLWDCHIEYATDIFGPDRIASMAARLVAVLRSLTASPRSPIGQLNLLAEAEREKILTEWGRAARDYPRDQCVHELFEEQVERTPEAEAVVFEGRRLNYRELNARANRLAHHLRSLGVGPDVAVGLCVERSLEMIVALAAILKAGGAYVPLDSALPSTRLKFMIASAGCRLIVTQASLRPALAQAVEAARMLFVEVEAPVDGPEENPAPLASPRDLAYIMYTSGSTGQPKGVEMPHQGLVNLLAWQASISGLGGSARTLQFASVGFDVSFQEIFSTLLFGGALVLIAEETRMHPAALLAVVREGRINRLFLPFVMLEHLAEAVANDESPPPPLREISVAGEQLRIGPGIRRLFERMPGCRFWNHYGPAEAHVVTSHELTGPPAVWPDLPPIGRPVANCEIYLLDAAMMPAPAGVTGELYIGGPCLARGYRGRPDLTAERFVPDPFGKDPTARLYRTGDLARWGSDGGVEFLGRADEQVKIRGFRVEPGEIEAVLETHPDVAACVVLAQDQSGGGKELVGYIMPRHPAHPVVASLRQWLKARLPDYLMPARLVAVAALPLNANGKVDRPALRQFDRMDASAGADYVAPSTETERLLAGIWQTVLRRERVGAQDNFFDLAGHSLSAVAMCSHISRQFGRRLALRSVFEHPTIAELAGLLQSPEAFARTTGAMEKADRRQPLPMSFGQQQMWLLRQTLPDPVAYNLPAIRRLRGPVEVEKIRQALQAIMQRHEVLRTALVQENDQLLQRVADPGQCPLPWREMDLTAAPPDGQETVLQQRLTEWTREAFDLARAPLWGVLWIELGGEERVLAFNFHHGIMDEWSMRLFFRELECLYNAGSAASLPALPAQYADYAGWQRQRLAGAALERDGAYWRNQLRDLPPALELPADRIRSSEPTRRVASHAFQIPPRLASALTGLARRENCTLFTVMLTAYQIWLHRHTGQSDVIVGSPVANREHPDTQHLLGYFLNTLALRTQLDDNAGFLTLARQMRETVLDAFDHAAMPFEQVVEAVVHERVTGQPPVFQVMFVLLEEGLPPLRLGNCEGRPEPVAAAASKYDLIWSVHTHQETWACQLEYATDLFSKERAASLADHLVELLRSVVENPERPVGQLNLLPAAERRQVLVEWNQTQSEYPRDKCIHHLFAGQAQETPEAVAVVYGEKTLTYRELDDRANQLAGHLRALGAGTESIVGLRVERSLEMVVAVLGILKAGGAYWAIEENLPGDRLRQLLTEARPKILLVRGQFADELAGALEAANSGAGGCPVVVLEEVLVRPAIDLAAPAPGQSPETPAYVSFTSGSTGRPKGVVVPHRGVARLVRGTNYVSLSEKEVLLHLSPLSFDASTFELWGALLNGGRVALMPPGPPALADIGGAIQRHGVTTMWLTAGLFHLMVEERLEDLKPLRQLLAGGDVLSPDHVRKARRALPGCRIINGYGPTENTTFTCCHTVEDAPTGSVPIGRPIANTRVYVLDARQQPAGIGLAGELYAGGDGLALGYLNQPELTAERFVPDPFSDRPGGRLYRTGDLARWRADGTLEFLGRLDAQVKIRGFRVELGEIETALRRRPEIQDAAVVAREERPGDKQLTAYLVARTPERPDAANLRAGLAKQLPDYMVPAAYAWLDKIPLTANGKVDRRALPAPEASAPSTAATETPANLLEWQLLQIWQKIFQRKDVGRRDNFFALGGHSLLATRLAAEIDRVLGCHLPVSALFQSPTVESLARRFTDENWKFAWTSLVPITPRGSKPPLFFIHGIHGNVYCFVGLAQMLGEDQPCHGIQAVGLDGNSPRHIKVEDMAAHYVKEMTAFQPEGPFYLVGYSLGGIIAYEIAQQLYRQGRRVAMLGMLDSSPVGRAPWPYAAMAEASYIIRRARFHGRRWWKLPFSERTAYFRGRWASLKKLARAKDTPAVVFTAPPPLSKQPPKLRLEYYHTIALPYEPGPYPGHVDFFASKDAYLAWRLYWRSLVRGGVSIHRVPGRHLEIISNENLPVMSAVLRKVLEQRQRDE